MARRKQARVRFITRETAAVTAARESVRVAEAVFTSFVREHHAAMNGPGARECYETTVARNNNLMEGIRVGQAGASSFARFAASFEAWRRGAKWATEERLTADAEAFARFVERECRPLATVIPLRTAQKENA